MEFWQWLLVPAAYLVGGIPFGLVVARLASGVDVRRHGSGNVGTTNVLRTAGWRAALVVLLLDIAKAAVAVGVARLLVGDATSVEDATLVVAVALAAIAGHNWSPYLKGKGGRGVASSLGVVIVLFPLAALASLVVSLPLIALSRYISLGSIAGGVVVCLAIAANVYLASLQGVYAVLVLVIALLIIVQHRGNIQRLLKGTERKLGERVAVQR